MDPIVVQTVADRLVTFILALIAALSAAGLTLVLMYLVTKQMKPDFVRGVSLMGYGVSLAIGVGIPIPILNPQILKRAAVRDRDIYAPVVDYSTDYPERTGKVLGHVNYEQLKSGQIEVNGKKIDVGSLSSYAKALEIAHLLRDQIARGEFLLSPPIRRLPLQQTMKPLKITEKAK